MHEPLHRSVVKFGFHLLYNQLAFTYDAVAWSVSLGQWKAWGRTALARVRGQRVLELGHGPGHLLIALARSGRSPIGIDLSPAMIRIARRRIQRAGVQVPQVRCHVQSLPFRSGVFDSAVSAFPTDYIVELATLREVQRVTNDRGRLIVVMGAQLAGRRPSTQFIEWLYRITGQRDARPEDEASAFDQAGLPARIETETIGASTVTLIVAEKQGRPGGRRARPGDTPRRADD